MFWKIFGVLGVIILIANIAIVRESLIGDSKKDSHFTVEAIKCKEGGLVNLPEGAEVISYDREANVVYILKPFIVVDTEEVNEE